MRERLRHLTTGVAIYGAGDAAINVVNLVLIAVYVKGGYLQKSDYGALGLIVSVEALAKIVSRWGLDGAFMRFYHEREEGVPRQTMASTILWFMLAANAALLAAALAGGGWIARFIHLDPSQIVALRLMFVNISLMAFTFLPMHAMRLRRQAVTFSAFTFARSVGTVILRIVLVIGLRWGVAGMYLADLAVTLILLPLMWPWCRALLGWRFSIGELRQTLRFGLPRLPHGLASQTLDSNPRFTLGQYVPAGDVGVYQNGLTLGTGVSFFKNAFETAFAPFYYSTARQPDAKVVFAKMATYGVAVFALLVGGTIVVARDAILLLLTPDYLNALPVVPLVAVAFGLQGVYQVTSIGLNLTSRTEFYSAATITAALVSLAGGWVLIPRYHIAGAAETVLLSYATQCAIACVLAQRFYPVPYEWSRLARVLLAAGAATPTGLWLVPSVASPWMGFLLRGTVTVATFALVLWITGFMRPTERAFMREVWTAARRRSRLGGPPPEPSDAN